MLRQKTSQLDRDIFCGYTLCNTNGQLNSRFFCQEWTSRMKCSTNSGRASSNASCDHKKWSGSSWNPVPFPCTRPSNRNNRTIRIVSNNCLPNAIEFGQIDADDRNSSIIIGNQVDQLEVVESETVRQIIWLKWEQSIGSKFNKRKDSIKVALPLD